MDWTGLDRLYSIFWMLRFGQRFAILIVCSNGYRYIIVHWPTLGMVSAHFFDNHVIGTGACTCVARGDGIVGVAAVVTGGAASDSDSHDVERLVRRLRLDDWRGNDHRNFWRTGFGTAFQW
jgi:hypothetical protein